MLDKINVDLRCYLSPGLGWPVSRIALELLFGFSDLVRSEAYLIAVLNLLSSEDSFVEEVA